MNKNIIGKGIIDLEFNGNIDGLKLQQDVDNWCHQVLLPKLDNVLLKYESVEDITSIDCLDIDITINEEREWLQNITGKIIQQVEEKLRGRNNFATKKTPSTSFKDLIIFYLQTGFLPWNNTITSKEQFNEELSVWLQSTTEENIRSIFSLLKNEIILRRFLYQFSTSQFIQFIARIAKTNHEIIRRLIRDVILIRENTQKYKLDVLYNFKKILIRQINYAPSENVLWESVHLWLQQLINSQTIVTKNLKVKRMNSPELKKAIQFVMKRSAMNIEESTVIMPVKSETSLATHNEINDNKKQETVDSAKSAKMLGEGIYINNAGVVIVASFLPSFYKSISLTEGNFISDPDKAANLLYYIITGKEHPPEFQLLLAKILSGIPAAQPVNTNMDIEEEYKNEADILLKSVIKHWKVLKNTSVNGLRESFLQREGRLSFENNEWLLIVEQKSYDILLEQLPWSFSVIYLPWMKNMLKVTWV